MPAQTYHHGDLKTQLIREGLRLLDAEGYQGFTLRKVAKLCGVSQTAPYRHFKNKDDLIAAITGQALRAFGEQLDSAVQKHPDDPKEQLREMGVAYVHFFVNNPEYLRLLFLSDISLRAHLTSMPDVREHYDSFQFLQTVTADYVNATPNTPFTQNELMVYSWGLVHGISTLIATGELPNNESILKAVDKVLGSIL
ncbi:MAG TPA: TetR/AcrR family transcriptional regulator [Candidatus Limiplasma sp.]|nr:TetR/AcrR family transcriptional regulator [Candidatus Limiplasma sp.]HRX07727.1 TetR/AcrR family transcriptional regulator [Candidatus Limiplasma sp.]